MEERGKRRIWDALRDLVPFVQFKKREKKHMEEDYLKLQASACIFTKSNTLPWELFTFFKWYQIAKSILKFWIPLRTSFFDEEKLFFTFFTGGERGLSVCQIWKNSRHNLPQSQNLTFIKWSHIERLVFKGWRTLILYSHKVNISVSSRPSLRTSIFNWDPLYKLQ